MHKFLQNKLWRDKAPDLMRAMGSIIHITELNDDEYEKQLKIKLLEESDEIRVAQTREKLIEELADLFEAVDALCALRQISLDDVHQRQAEKRTEKGGFYKRMFVTTAEHLAGSYGEKYCRADPEKYPEVV